jgi:hypothetical protein
VAPRALAAKDSAAKCPSERRVNGRVEERFGIEFDGVGNWVWRGRRWWGG